MTPCPREPWSLRRADTVLNTDAGLRAPTRPVDNTDAT